MAMSDEIKEQIDSLKGKGWKAKWQWFVDYELVKVLIIAAVVIMIVAVVYQSVTSVPYVFGVVFVNAAADEDQTEELEDDFAEYIELDQSQGELMIDLTESMSVGDSQDIYDLYTNEALIVKIAAEEIDVWVSDAYTFENYLSNDMFMDLRDILDEEQIEKYEDLFYYVDQPVLTEEEEEAQEQAELEEASNTENTVSSEEAYASMELDSFVYPDPSTMENPVPVGIVCNSAAYIEDHHNYDTYVCVMGVIANTEYPDVCSEFIEYLFENP